jgi:hypothetical protein
MSEPILLEVRERRSRFGRIVKWTFWAFQLVMLLGVLGTCALVAPFVQGDDPEVAMGAGMFGAMALGTLWVVWPLGTVVLGLLLFLTRGRKRYIQDPGTPQAPPPPLQPQAQAQASPVPRRPGGSVPPTGGPG